MTNNLPKRNNKTIKNDFQLLNTDTIQLNKKQRLKNEAKEIIRKGIKNLTFIDSQMLQYIDVELYKLRYLNSEWIEICNCTENEINSINENDTKNIPQNLVAFKRSLYRSELYKPLGRLYRFDWPKNHNFDEFQEIQRCYNYLLENKFDIYEYICREILYETNSKITSKIDKWACLLLNYLEHKKWYEHGNNIRYGWSLLCPNSECEYDSEYNSEES